MSATHVAATPESTSNDGETRKVTPPPVMTKYNSLLKFFADKSLKFRSALDQCFVRSPFVPKRSFFGPSLLDGLLYTKSNRRIKKLASRRCCIRPCNLPIRSSRSALGSSRTFGDTSKSRYPWCLWSSCTSWKSDLVSVVIISEHCSSSLWKWH